MNVKNITTNPFRYHQIIKKKKYFKNYVQWYEQKNRKQTSIQCKKYQVPLCPLCFKDYHACSTRKINTIIFKT